MRTSSGIARFMIATAVTIMVIAVIEAVARFSQQLDCGAAVQLPLKLEI